MANTSSRQPLPSELALHRSKGYLFELGNFTQRPTILEAALNPAPAGSFCSTATDVARFMSAHLSAGCYGNGCILRPATVELMHRRHFAHDPRVNGFAHGFWELDTSGQRIIGHAGSHFIFSSLLLLFPQHRLGVFVATNSTGSAAFLANNFVDRTFPQQVPPVAKVSSIGTGAARLSGTYHMTMGRSESTPEKLFGLLMAFGFKAQGEGLTVSLPWGNERYVEIEPMVFREATRDTRVIFHAAPHGKLQAFYGPTPVTALIKNRWFESLGWNLGLLGFCLLMFVTYTIAVIVRTLVRLRKTEGRSSTPSEYLIAGCGLAVSIVGIALLVSIVVFLGDMVGLYLGHVPLWWLVQSLSVALVVLTCLIVLGVEHAWRSSRLTPVRRVHLSLVAASAGGLVWFTYFWNLLGSHLGP
jgi:hypothetical protein